MMHQLPSVHASGDLTLEEASAGSIFCQWQFPLLPGPETSENSRRAVQRIIRQCKLVCSKTSERQEKMKIVRRLLFAWHPDNASCGLYSGLSVVAKVAKLFVFLLAVDSTSCDAFAVT